MEYTSYISQIVYQIEVWIFEGLTLDYMKILITELQNRGQFSPNLVLINAYLDDRFGNSGCAFLDTVTGETIVGFAGTNLDNRLGEALKDMAANAKIGVAGGHTANSEYMK